MSSLPFKIHQKENGYSQKRVQNVERYESIKFKSLFFP